MVVPGLLPVSASGAFVGPPVAHDLADAPEHQATVPGNDLVAPDGPAVLRSGAALTLIFRPGLALLWASRRPGSRMGTAGTAGTGRPGRHRAGYREAEPVEPVEPVERATTGADDHAHGDRASDDRTGRAPGSDEVLAPPEERAVEPGGRETPERPGGRRRHRFGH
ncbi:hypothetical protein [Kitasatospora sp. NPDC059599]|uniref:hypothetical protein n=1 Tax=Kitasatospora sp. NPDC059599 TaxID=3346880 RepID=UPI00368EAA36